MKPAEPIAILGIGCRFPGGIASPRDLWSVLVEGKSVVGPIPEDRRPAVGSGVPPWGGFLDDIWGFDASFFGLSPREAAAIDPQHRLLLQTTWEALEDAGIAPRTIRGSDAGIYVGLTGNEYAAWTNPAEMRGYLGSARNGAAGRIAYAFDLHGPARVVDTDRSSGLVALHDACNALRLGECDTAIVGAASLILGPDVGLAFARAGMLAADGKCKFADAAADGFVRSEGVATLVLRPLSRALADGSPIYAVVRGGAVMANGNVAGDLMGQSAERQASLLERVYANAGLRPDALVYVEAHGSGTWLGDRAELAALDRFVSSGGRRPPCWVGSVKTNLGHAEACAGLAGVIKVALAAERGVLPPSLHFRQFPEGTFPGDPSLRVVTEAVALPGDVPFVAGVSSFGLTGIDAHVAITAAPPRAAEAPAEASPVSVLCVSSSHDDGLRAMARRHAELVRAPDTSLDDVCFSAATTREHLPHRAVFLGRTRDDMARELETFASRSAPDSAFVSGRADAPAPDGVVFVFPGQGSQWPGMGKRLLRESPVFAETMRACDRVLRDEAGFSLLEEVDSGARFDRIDVVQPVLVAMEIALAALWASWGVRPIAVVGTSMGEVAAAHVAGALSLEDALRIIVRRTRLMRTVPGGAMAVVDLSADVVAARLDPARVSIAAVNSPSSTVVSGEREAVEALVRAFQDADVFAKLVRVDVASHSPKMDPILDALREELRDVAPRATSIPFVSTVEKRIVEGTELGADYWARNLRMPVDLASAVQALGANGDPAFVEVSPHPVLRAALLDNLAERSGRRTVLFTLERDQDELRTALGALGRLHATGFPVAWERALGRHAVVRLPPHAWANRRCVEGQPSSSSSAPAPSADVSVAEASVATPLLERLRGAPAGVVASLVEAEVRREIGRILGVRPESIEPARPLREIGLTSVSGTELRATLATLFARAIPSSLLYDCPTVRALAKRLATDLRGDAAEAVAPERAAAGARDDIAIVGLALRLPGGVDSLASLWSLLEARRDGIVEVPQGRWDRELLYDADVREKGKMHTKWGGFVEAMALFDAEFFGISPREAEAMDPQQRVLLELAWEALENAGTSRSQVEGSRTGVFVGIMNNNEYARRKGLDEHPERITGHTSTADATSIAAGRISYFFGLEGPAMAVDTACSSSLVALHLAAESIRRGECSAALVAGVNLVAHPTTTIAFSKTRMLSPTGACRTFDAAADGYVRGEGACVLVLKPLRAALEAHDNVLAVVRGTAVNQDGRSSGLTAPNGRAQQAVIERAIAQAGLEAADVSYVEAHGTGTPLGDPIEVDALVRVFSASRTTDEPLLVGSIKPNIGHLEACAGLAGVAKVIAAMQARRIPAQAHLTRLNPRLVLPAWCVIPREHHAWSTRRETRVAGVSSFGFSGTNAHAILEEAPRRVREPQEVTDPALVCISATTPEALRRMADAYLGFVDREGEALDLATIAYASSRREHLPVRAVAVATSMGRLREQLLALAEGRQAAGLVSGAALAEPAVALVYPTTADAWPTGSERPRPTRRVREALDRWAASDHDRHVAHFARQYAWTETWRAWVKAPPSLVGIGSGEVAAAVAAGIFDVDSAVRLLVRLGEREVGREESADAIEAVARTIDLHRPTLPFVSSVTGRVEMDLPRTASYWRHLAAAPTVRSAADLAAAAGANLVIAMGPGLEATLADTLARMFVAGLDVSWDRYYDERSIGFCPLPPYAFSRRAHWIAAPKEGRHE